MLYKTLLIAAGSAIALTTLATPRAMADEVRIGMLLTLSGAASAIGEHIRDGFNLAVDERDGKLGGVDVRVFIEDDELQPDVGVNRANALIERDEIDIFVGTVFSNVMMAVIGPLLEAGVVTVSPNAGPSPLAGEQCNRLYFNVAWQNDQNHSVLGRSASEQGYERVVVMAPNYQAGRDGIAGFKRFYDGEVVDEIYTQLGQMDFSAEIARIAAIQPDAFYTFMPGGMGVALVRQYRQAGLADSIPFLSAFTIDETTLPAMRQEAVGMLSGSQWTPTLDVPANQRFVAAYRDAYGHFPSYFASQGYDTALALDAALRKVGGDAGDTDALIEALRSATFDSVRGNFAFNHNQFPIQDFYLVEVVEHEDGDFVTSAVGKVFEMQGDAYAQDCRME